MEQVSWIDESTPDLTKSDAADAVAKLIASPVDGQLMTGIIDRLHLHRDESGTVTRVEIIDYKTDAVASAHELVDRYSGQMRAYQTTLKKIHPNAEVVPILISVKHAELVHL